MSTNLFTVSNKTSLNIAPQNSMEAITILNGV